MHAGLTLRALLALQNADVLAFEEGVSATVLDLARRDAARIRIAPQEPIDRRSMDAARAGGNVVVIARAALSAASLDRLRGAGVPVTVLPGAAAPINIRPTFAEAA